MQHYLSVSTAARRVGASPKDLSDALYQGKIDGDHCPIVAGRRLIPEDYLPQIEAALRRTDRTLGKAVADAR